MTINNELLSYYDKILLNTSTIFVLLKLFCVEQSLQLLYVLYSNNFTRPEKHK